MGYEFLLFQLADLLRDQLNDKEVEKLWFQTDLGLLMSLYKNSHVAHIIRRLMKGEMYVVINIMKIPDNNKLIYKKLKDISFAKRLCESLEDYLDSQEPNFVSKVLGKLYIHVTTDFRKTDRKIDFFLEDEKGIGPYSFGENKNSTLISLLSRKKPPQEYLELIQESAMKAIYDLIHSNVSTAPIHRFFSDFQADKKRHNQQTLFEFHDR